MTLTADERAEFDQLAERVNELEDKTQRQATLIEQQEQQIDDLQTENENQEEQIDRLQKENEDQEEQIHDLQRGQAQDRQRLAELEDYRPENERDKATIRQQVAQLEQAEPASNSENAQRDSDGRSPLAQLIDVPAERAKEFLSANQQRGRKIAQRAIEIGTETPNGLVVRSDQITTHLRRWEESAHTETVSRVIDFIDQLGCDDVHSKTHKGRRILVFDPTRVERYGMGEEPNGIKSQRDVIPAQMNEPTSATA